MGHIALNGSPKSATRAAQPPLRRPPEPIVLHGFGENPEHRRSSAIPANPGVVLRLWRKTFGRWSLSGRSGLAKCCQRPISRDEGSILGRFCFQCPSFWDARSTRTTASSSSAFPRQSRGGKDAFQRVVGRMARRDVPKSSCHGRLPLLQTSPGPIARRDFGGKL